MQRVLVDSTASILSYPRLAVDGIIATGVPSSATARRVPPQAADASTAYVAATVDSLSTTVQGAQSEGADSVTLAGAVTLVAGRRYLITDANHGKTVVVTATNSGSSSTMYLQEPLPYAVANGSTVRGIAVTVALTAAQTADPGAGYVLFRATVDGTVREWDEPFRVVRRITSIALTTTELTQSYPVIRQIASSTDLTLEEAIQASWRMVMVPALSARGVLDEDILTDDVLVPMHATATVLHLARQWPAAPSEFVDRLAASYEQIKQTTWDRIDLITRSQDDVTPDLPTPGSQGPRYMGLTR
jgi:hypothetical protein